MSDSNKSDAGSQKEPHQVADFDEILDRVGNAGRYQNIVIYVFVVLVSACSPFLMFGNVFVLDVPDHWCSGPGAPSPSAQDFPAQLELWKKQNLPLVIGGSGVEEFSKCQMFDPTSKNSTIDCPNGWSYDKTNYRSTIPTDYNWVCDKETYAPNAFTYAIAGGVVGTVVFGSLADKIGRKPIILIVCAINLAFRAVSLYVPHMVTLFFIAQFITGLCFPPLYSIILVLASEVCGAATRSWCYVMFWVGWVGGNCLLPVTFWWIGDWYPFGLLSLIPGIMILLLIPFMKESPRWLISAGKIQKAAEILVEIARTNGVPIELGLLEKMIKSLQEDKTTIAQKSKNATGFWTLFQKHRLAKNTIAVTVAVTMNNVLYYGVTLNVAKMAGNMYLNYFLLGAIELPSSLLAGVLVEKTGRRWTQTAFFTLCALSCVLSLLGVLHPSLSFLGIVGGLGIKFGISVSSLIALLQCSELFPTELRSTGTSFATTVMTLVGVACPYIVFTGNYNTTYPYLIFLACSVLGMGSSCILPETFHQHLPETVEDANNFGKGVKFWSYLPKDKTQTDKEVKVDALG